MAKRALCVGIDEFRAIQIPVLKGAVRDARNLGSALSSQFGFDEVINLANDEASKGAILGKIGELLSRCAPGDEFVFFMASYGCQYPDASWDPSRGMDELFIAHDHQWGWQQNLMLRDDEVALALSRAQQGVNITCIFDSSPGGEPASEGQAAKASRYLAAPDNEAAVAQAKQHGLGFGGRLRQLAPHEAWLCLFAGAPSQTVQEGRLGMGHEGAFTHHVLAALQAGAANQGWQGVVSHAAQGMQAAGYQSQPQMVGASNRPVFGGASAAGAGATGGGSAPGAYGPPQTSGPGAYGPPGGAQPGQAPGFGGGQPNQPTGGQPGFGGGQPGGQPGFGGGQPAGQPGFGGGQPGGQPGFGGGQPSQPGGSPGFGTAAAVGAAAIGGAAVIGGAASLLGGGGSNPQGGAPAAGFGGGQPAGAPPGFGGGQPPGFGGTQPAAAQPGFGGTQPGQPGGGYGQTPPGFGGQPGQGMGGPGTAAPGYPLANTPQAGGFGAPSNPIDKALAEFPPDATTVKVCNGIFGVLPFAPQLPPYQNLAGAGQVLLPQAGPQGSARLVQLANTEDIGKALWVADAVDKADMGISAFSGVKGVLGMFFGDSKSDALETDPQQGVDAIVKFLAMSYMVHRLFPGSAAQKAQSYYNTPAGKAITMYFAAVEICLPFADNALSAGGSMLQHLWQKFGSQAVGKVGGFMDQKAAADAQGMAGSLLRPVQGVVNQVMPHARKVADSAVRFLPGVMNVADKAAGAVATAADVLPVYRYLGGRLAAEACVYRLSQGGLSS